MKIEVEENGWDAGCVTCDGHPIGLVWFSPKLNLWCATWNMVPNDGDKEYYKYPTREAAIERLLEWEKECDEQRKRT